MGLLDPWRHHLKGSKTCLEPISTIMQNFTPIGVTVADISVTGQRNKNNSKLITLPCSHTNVWRARQKHRYIVISLHHNKHRRPKAKSRRGSEPVSPTNLNFKFKLNKTNFKKRYFLAPENMTLQYIGLFLETSRDRIIIRRNAPHSLH